jgi:hypothetical protein
MELEAGMYEIEVAYLTSAETMNEFLAEHGIDEVGDEFYEYKANGTWTTEYSIGLEDASGMGIGFKVAFVIGLAVVLSKYTSLITFSSDVYPALIALFASPVAVSSAVMAGSMGGDEQLATQLVVWTSLFSILTIFAEVCILMSMGILAIAG